MNDTTSYGREIQECMDTFDAMIEKESRYLRYFSSERNGLNSSSSTCSSSLLRAPISNSQQGYDPKQEEDDWESPRDSKRIKTSKGKISKTYPMSPFSVIQDDLSSTPSSTKDRLSAQDNDSCSVSPSIRREVCSWMYKVIDHYSFDRHIVSYGMKFFIGYATSCTKDEVESFELVTATSLYLAIKIHGPKLSRHDDLLCNFAHMSDCRYVKDDLVNMEMKMLQKFSWYVNPVTPQDIIPYLVKLLCYFGKKRRNDQSFQSSLIELSWYMIELLVFDPLFDKEKASSIAYACVVLALRGILATEQIENITSDHEELIDFLLPFFTKGLADQSIVCSLVEEIGSYFQSISPKLSNSHLDSDRTGISFQYAISYQ